MDSVFYDKPYKYRYVCLKLFFVTGLLCFLSAIQFTLNKVKVITFLSFAVYL